MYLLGVPYTVALLSGRNFVGTFMVALLSLGMGKSAPYLISVLYAGTVPVVLVIYFLRKIRFRWAFDSAGTGNFKIKIFNFSPGFKNNQKQGSIKKI